MYYLATIKTLSSGSIEKSFNSYEDRDTCLRKFHEAFNVIGGGPKKISAVMMEDLEQTITDPNAKETKVSNILIEKNETWTATEIVEQNE